MKRSSLLLGAVAVGLGFGSLAVAQAETVISVTQVSYNYKNQPVCTAQRMNPAVYSSLPSDACTLGTAGTDGPDRITKNTYDVAGQVTQVDQAYGTSVQRAYARYTYTNNGLKQTERDANGNTTTYEYDGFDRLNKLRYPVATVNSTSSSTTDYETYGYDAANNRTSWRRRDGNTILYTYDSLNREIVKDMPGGTADDLYTGYDGLGHIVYKRFVSSGGSGVSYAYDGLGRVSSTTDMNGRTLSLGYLSNSARQ
ncbi:RHS repeat-associated core domain-containing protein, partial [Asticcacaulis sp. 201]|nr:RHS repeat-associated core domain-containing protein [Asticcacaulis sp. 201]